MSEEAQIPEIGVDELPAAVDNGTALIDVRMPDEYEEAHVPGAVLIPLPEISDRIGELPDGRLGLICRSGGRSMKACEFLAGQGRDVVNVAGGTLAWIESGREVRTGTEPG